jgi:peptidoglycan/LPS O-acetylase OafA/YrhL
LIWPFLVFFLPRQWLTKTLWAIVAMAVLFRILIVPFHSDSYIFITFSRFDGLAAGALLATYYHRNLLQRHRRGILLLAVLSAVAIWFQWWKFHAQGAPWVQVTKFSLATFFYAAVVGYLIISGRILANRLLRLRPLRFIGKVSYGLYVFHPIVFAVVLPRVRSLSAVVQLLACFGATFLVAMISWYGYEVWFIRLKDKLAPERSKQSLPVAA